LSAGDRSSRTRPNRRLPAIMRPSGDGAPGRARSSRRDELMHPIWPVRFVHGGINLWRQPGSRTSRRIELPGGGGGGRGGGVARFVEARRSRQPPLPGAAAHQPGHHDRRRSQATAELQCPTGSSFLVELAVTVHHGTALEFASQNSLLGAPPTTQPDRAAFRNFLADIRLQR